MLCFRRVYWLLRRCSEYVRVLSSLLGLAQVLRLCAVLLLYCLYLCTSDRHIVMHWATFRCVTPHSSDQRSQTQLRRLIPMVLTFHVYRIRRLMQICVLCCAEVRGFGHCACVPTQSSHLHNNHWAQPDCSCLAGKFWNCTVGSTQTPWIVRKWQRRQSACFWRSAVWTSLDKRGC